MKTLQNQISTKITLIVFAIATSMFSCQKNGLAPVTSASQISFGVQATATSATIPSLAATNATAAVTPTIVWTQGIANIAEFKFEATKAGKETEIKTHGLSNVDLFALSPALVNTTIDSGTYSQIEIKMEFLKSATTAIPLTMKGTFTNDAGAIIPVEIDFNEDLEIKAEASNVVVDNSTNLTTIMTLHLNQLLSGISAADLNSAIKSAGTIIISTTTNTSIFNKIKLNVSHCGDTKVESEHQHNESGSGEGAGHH